MRLKTKLLDHQIKPYEKLKKIKIGALYMEMGTGKTRTALELIKDRIERNKVDFILWLCPFSIKDEIKKEINKHTDDMDYFRIEGIETLSSSLKTNVELLELVKQKRVYLIVDESNLVKNPKAKRTENITRLAEYCQYKLILNGTPISRTEADLYSQWYILDWRILGYRSYWSFEANHIEYDQRNPDRIVKCLNTDYLTHKIAPYTYQVKKKDCFTLPPKTYNTAYFRLTDSQDFHYAQVAERMINQIEDMQPETIYRMFSALQSIISGRYVHDEGHITTEPFFDKPEDNPRIQKLLDLINPEYKTIIFAKYIHEIKDIVKTVNDYYGDIAIPFYGELSKKKRKENLQKFRKDKNILVANKETAGYGLNLQESSYIIFYSNDFDYATRIQAEDRVHRYGQTENVHIVDICAVNTLDEQILYNLSSKESMLDSFKKELHEKKDKESIMRFIRGENIEKIQR